MSRREDRSDQIACGPRVTRRRAFAGPLALGGLGGALAAACGGPEAGGQQSAQQAGARAAPVTLRFWSWRPIAMDQFAPIWKEYGAAHNVAFEVDPSGDYEQAKLTTMLVSDTAPDVWDGRTDVLLKMYDSGWVLPLDRHLARDKVALDRDWVPTGVERWRQKVYGVPYWADSYAIYYNKTLFRQKGAEDPWERSRDRGQWTLEELVAAARRVHDPGADVWGLDWGLASLTGIGPLIWTQGVSHVQTDPKIELQLTLPEVVEAHEWALDWMMRQQLNVQGPAPEATAARARLQAGRPGIATTGGTNLFALGRVGIHWRSAVDWQRMWPLIGTAFEWDMLPVPSIKGKPGASLTGSHPLNAWARTKHPDEAWAFMRWMIQDEFQAFLAEHRYLTPARRSHQARFFRVAEQYRYQHPQVLGDVYRRPFGLLWGAHYNAVQNMQTYATEVLKLYRGEAPLRPGLTELNRLLNQEVDYGGGENPFKGTRWPLQPR